MSLVVFDLDGTLVDTVPAFRAAVQDVGSSSADDLPSTDQIREIVARTRSYAGVFEALLDHIPANTGPGAKDRIQEAFGQEYPTHAKLYPGVYRLMMALEGRAACGLAGTAEVSLLDEMVDYFGLDGYIAYTFSTGRGESALARTVVDWMETCGAPAGDSLWVSSRPWQLEIGRKLGLTTVFCEYGYGGSPAGNVDHRLERLSGLFSLFS
jgi:phosphoglycolate phosphatase-like HAD superfamily hydrolase